jgi:putative hydrolase of the HAD superfamily
MMTGTDTQPEIRAVIFDLGRVLVNIDNPLLVKKLFKGLDADNPQELGRNTMRDPAMVEFNCGRIPAQEFHRRMCERYQLDLEFDTFKKLWCEIFYPMDGMEDLVRSVSKKRTVGLLSDTDPIHWSFIRTRWPWIAAIKNPTLSYEVGSMKPEAAIYLAAAENVNTPVQHCLFIDDLQTNIDGARAVGMRAIRFENKDSLARELAISGLLESTGHQGAEKKPA